MVKPPGMMADVGRSSAAKRVGRGALKRAAAAHDLVRRPQPGLVVLCYHRVGRRTTSRVDLSAGLFEEKWPGCGGQRCGRPRRRGGRAGRAAPIGARCGGHHLRRRHRGLRRGGAAHFGPAPGARHPVRGDRLRRTRPAVPRERHPPQLVRPGGRRLDGTRDGRLPHRHPRPPRSAARCRGGRGPRPLHLPDRRAGWVSSLDTSPTPRRCPARRRPTERAPRASPPPLSRAPGPTPTEGPTRIAWPARRCRWTTGWTSSTARWAGGCAWRTTCGVWSTVAVWRAPPLEGAPARRHHDGHDTGPAAPGAGGGRHRPRPKRDFDQRQVIATTLAVYEELLERKAHRGGPRR